MAASMTPTRRPRPGRSSAARSPTGEREGGYREPESGARIALIVGVVIAVIVIALLVIFLR